MNYTIYLVFLLVWNLLYLSYFETYLGTQPSNVSRWPAEYAIRFAQLATDFQVIEKHSFEKNVVALSQ